MNTEQIPHTAVFIDRDGTLNREVDYLHRIEDFQWIPGVPEAVRRLNEAALLVIVVTNQAGVARGFYDEAAVGRLHAYIQNRLHDEVGAHIDAFYYSPYHPDGSVAAYRKVSSCRKPGIGMFERAVEEWRIDPANSFVIGDKNSDIDAGRELGMTTFLVETGYGAREKAVTQANYIVPDFAAAVDQILRVLY